MPQNSEIIATINQIVQQLNVHNQLLNKYESLTQKLRLENELLAGVTGSTSQFKQDLFVLKESKYKRGGYFVEFGATNGVEGSNTCFLEKQFGWTGILAEPARCWADDLAKNRNVIIDHRCVWERSGKQIEFHEADVATLSTAKEFSESDFHSASRAKGKSYTVETVSLTDLLDQHQAPKTIDYLSIDTEGSELMILAAFDFSKYDIRVITCEHNWTPDRAKINQLLASQGYELKHANLTDCDDWYVKV